MQVAGNAVSLGTKSSLVKTLRKKYKSNDVRSDLQSIISTDTLKRLRYLYKKHPLMEQIRSVLQKSIWSGGVNLYKVNKEASHFLNGEKRIPYTPPPRVQHSLDTRWDYLKYEILDHLLCYGWVVIKFNEIKDKREEEPEIVPFVVPVEFYRMCVTTNLEDGSVLRALNVRDQDEIENCVVFHRFGYDPTPDGRLNSLVSKAAAAITFMMNHETTDSIVRQLRCRPTAYVEKGTLTKNEAQGSALGQSRALLEGLESDSLGYTTVDHMNATSVKEGQVPLPFGYSLDADMQRNDLMYKRAKHKAAMERGDPVAAAAVGLDNETNTQRNMGSMTGIVMGAGETVKFAPSISEASNFDPVRRCMQETIAGVFGVPLSVLTGTGRSGGSQNQQASQQTKTVHAMFRLTVQEWRGKLSRVLTDCFSECWFSLMMKDGDSGERKAPLASIDAYKESERRKIHLDFAPSTFVGNEQIRELYEWGVIPFEVFGKYCMANCSLPVEEMNKAPPSDNPLGVGLPDPNAELDLKEKEVDINKRLKEKELGVKKDELSFKEKESENAVKREEKAAKEEKKAKEDDEKKKAAASKKRKASGGSSSGSSGSSGSNKKAKEGGGKIELVISTK